MMAMMCVNQHSPHRLRLGMVYRLPSLRRLQLLLALLAIFLVYAGPRVSVTASSSNPPTVCPRDLVPDPEYNLDNPYHHPSTRSTTPRGNPETGSGDLDMSLKDLDADITNQETDNSSGANKAMSPNHALTAQTTTVTATTATATAPPAVRRATETKPRTTTQTYLPFPVALYDTPGHAIASGLFLGAAASALLWIIGCIVLVYTKWIWRGVGDVRRGLQPVDRNINMNREGALRAQGLQVGLGY
ncbi:hypothetical protein N657DRAFT_395760 [Parathielavia appendiculata]|uniref:Uncharacterized protein n=1 Tax=Parathielavia appendiculata TaxID=2587402 RepID=A0AAN6U183_9PEZI|nr:hypothetical protein N657DRAFT_395760 [Parathielavia appendiculata]